MDCIVHRVAKSRTQLSDFHFHHANSFKNRTVVSKKLIIGEIREKKEPRSAFFQVSTFRMQVRLKTRSLVNTHRPGSDVFRGRACWSLHHERWTHKVAARCAEL